MPFRRRKIRRGKGRRKRVPIRKLISSMTTRNVESTQIVGTNPPALFVGNVVATGLDAASAYPLVLTTLVEGSSIQQRGGPQVQFTRLRGTVWYQPPTTGSNNGGRIVRVLILKVKTMPQASSLASRYPTIEEVFITAAITNQADIFCQQQPDQIIQSPKQRNYTIVYDRSKQYQFSGTSLSDTSQMIWRYSIKVPRGEKATYQGTANNVAACLNNHYILLVLIDGQLTGTATNAFCAAVHNEYLM